LSPVFILRRFLLDPFLAFPSLTVRDHPHSPRSDCNFSSVLVRDEESCCLQSTQDFDIVIQLMVFSLSHSPRLPADHSPSLLSGSTPRVLPATQPPRFEMFPHLVMVQAWSIAVQVARPSPISIETPPYCSIVRTESAITHTNPRPGVTVSYLSILSGCITTSANPTVMVIQQWSKQRFHPRVSDTLP
jgi:hypothetical protein